MLKCLVPNVGGKIIRGVLVWWENYYGEGVGGRGGKCLHNDIRD